MIIQLARMLTTCRLGYCINSVIVYHEYRQLGPESRYELCQLGKTDSQE